LIYYSIYKAKELIGIGFSQGEVIPSGNNQFSYKKITKNKYEELDKQ